ncbi:MAG: hypothetical protein LBS01_04175 [Prevotellaceae bacterium]|jgi:hypothetical protein|nr:hypothetical protein [Prevotellaceae bacterium]
MKTRFILSKNLKHYICKTKIGTMTRLQRKNCTVMRLEEFVELPKEIEAEMFNGYYSAMRIAARRETQRRPCFLRALRMTK